jgi:hypothetical protein
VFSDALALGEDIDLGWVSVRERTPCAAYEPDGSTIKGSVEGLMQQRVSMPKDLQPKGGQGACDSPPKLDNANEEVPPHDKPCRIRRRSATGRSATDRNDTDCSATCTN